MEISREKLLEVITHFWDSRNAKTVTPEFLVHAIESASEPHQTVSFKDNKETPTEK